MSHVSAENVDSIRLYDSQNSPTISLAQACSSKTIQPQIATTIWIWYNDLAVKKQVLNSPIILFLLSLNCAVVSYLI
jgi:hypothetical protein